MSLEHDLLEIEKTFWTGGAEAYRQHVDDTCLVVFAEMAKSMPKEEIAGSVEDGRWKDVSMTPKGLAQLTPESAVVSYDCTAKRKDGEPYHALVSSGYVKRDDGWKLAFHQQTPV